MSWQVGLDAGQVEMLISVFNLCIFLAFTITFIIRYWVLILLVTYMYYNIFLLFAKDVVSQNHF